MKAEMINGWLYINNVRWEGTAEETERIMYQIRIQCEMKGYEKRKSTVSR